MVGRFILGASALFLVTGCVSADSEGVGGPYYNEGFSDGCRTAQARQSSFSTQTYRDQLLFDQEVSYRAGWRIGFQECDRGQVSTRPDDFGEATRSGEF